MNSDQKHPSQKTNEILFVGAGPGDPELITVKGARALNKADLIVYAGSLVPEAVLVHAREGARKISSASLTLDEIMDLMAQAWNRGQKVVRLHTGDPALYGAIGEQMARLDRLEIPHRVIPGVSAAFAAAAALKAEFTLPDISQTLIFTRMAGRTPVPEAESLASLAAHQSSMAVYLSAGMMEKVAQNLLTAYPPDTPAAIVYKASHPEQRVIATRLKDLVREAEKAGITRQAVILVGRALGAEARDGAHESKLYDAGFSHGFRDKDNGEN